MGTQLRQGGEAVHRELLLQAGEREAYLAGHLGQRGGSMAGTRIQLQEGSTFALDDFSADGEIHIEDLGGRLFIGVDAAGTYYHFEVVPTRDEFGPSLCCRLMSEETA